MIRIPPLLEKFITIFSLIFYTRLFSFESLFVHSEGELAVSSPDYTPLDPLLSLPLTFLVITRVIVGNSTTSSQLEAGLWIRIRIGSVFNRVCGSGSKRAKMTHKSRQ